MGLKRSAVTVKIFGLKVAEYISIDTRPLCDCRIRHASYENAILRSVTPPDPTTGMVGLGFQLGTGQICRLALDKKSIRDLKNVLVTDETATRKDRTGA